MDHDKLTSHAKKNSIIEIQIEPKEFTHFRIFLSLLENENPNFADFERNKQFPDKQCITNSGHGLS